MSRKGQEGWKPARPIAVFALDFAQGTTTGRHQHPFAQLVHASSGVLRVITDRGAWVVPPGRAIWMPAHFEHEVRMMTSAQMRTVYVTEEALPKGPKDARVVEVPPLLRELIFQALRLPRPYPLGGAEERLFRVLADQISFRKVIPVFLPQPSSEQLRSIAQRLERDPSDQRTLPAWARLGKKSARTLARAFVRETGLTFGAFRAQLRLLRALELLTQQQRVTDVALALGYDSTSAFISKFRRHFGTTPARFFRSNQSGSP
jgi:AraC-like DNA-binding protein